MKRAATGSVSKIYRTTLLVKLRKISTWKRKFFSNFCQIINIRKAPSKITRTPPKKLSLQFPSEEENLRINQKSRTF